MNQKITFKQYQDEAIKTAVYPQDNPTIELAYLVLALNGEIGELFQAWRDANRDAILDEAGDVLWYVAMYVRRFVMPMTAGDDGDLWDNCRDYILNDIQRAFAQETTAFYNNAVLMFPEEIIRHGLRLSEMTKKLIRNGDDPHKQTNVIDFTQKYLYILDALSIIAASRGKTLPDIATSNLRKLAERAASGTLKQR